MSNKYTKVTRLARLTRFINNFHYYWKKGFHFQDAWHLANMTLPE